MAKPIFSRKKAHVLSMVAVLLGFALLTYLKTWWPAVLLVLGLSLALRQYLLGKRFDMAISLFVFIGAFITIQFNIQWQTILPVLFILGAVYILIREFFVEKETKDSDLDNDDDQK